MITCMKDSRTRQVPRGNWADMLERDIRRQVLDKELPEGQRLPPVRELAREYGLSYATVLRRIHNLCREGYLERRHGSGVFVRPKRQVRVALAPGFATSTAFADLMRLFVTYVSAVNGVEYVLVEVPPEKLALVIDQYDVLFISDAMLMHDLPSEQLCPIEECLAIPAGDRSGSFSSVLGPGSGGGKLHMLPLLMSPVTLIYNRTLLGASELEARLLVASSLADLVGIHAELSNRAAPCRQGVTMALEHRRVLPFLHAFTPQALPLHEVSLAHTEVRQAFRRLKEFLLGMNVSRPVRATNEPLEQFLAGDAWGLIDQTTHLRRIREKADFGLGVAPLPLPATSLLNLGLAVTKQGAGKPGIEELVNFVTNDGALSLIGREGGFVPTERRVARRACLGNESPAETWPHFLPEVVERGVAAAGGARALENVCEAAWQAWDLL